MMLLAVRSSKMDGSQKRSKVQTMLQKFESHDKNGEKFQPVTSIRTKLDCPVVADFKDNQSNQRRNQSVISQQDDRTTPPKSTSSLTDVQESNNSPEVLDTVQTLLKRFQEEKTADSVNSTGEKRLLTPVPPLRRHRPKPSTPVDSRPSTPVKPNCILAEKTDSNSQGNTKDNTDQPTIAKDGKCSKRKYFSKEDVKEKELCSDDNKDVLTRLKLRCTPVSWRKQTVVHMSAENSKKPVPLGPPPAKPPRTFAHDIYIAQKQADLDNTTSEHGSLVLKTAAKFEGGWFPNVAQRSGKVGTKRTVQIKHKSCFSDASFDDENDGAKDIVKRNIPSPPNNIPFLEPSPLSRKIVTPYAISNIAHLPPSKYSHRDDTSLNTSLPKRKSRFFVDFDEVQNLSPMKRCFSDDHIYEEVTKPCFNQPMLLRTLSAGSEEMFLDNIQYDTITCQENCSLKDQSMLASTYRTSHVNAKEPYQRRTTVHGELNQWKLAAHFAHARAIHRIKGSKRQVPSYVHDIISEAFSQVNNGVNSENVSSDNLHVIHDEDSGDSDNELTSSDVQKRISYFRTISRVASIKHDVVNQSNQLFDYILIVGLQSCEEKNGELLPYIKLAHPTLVETHFKHWVPHVCFPGSEFWKPTPSGETYMSVFTGQTGERKFGYCRRIKPDGCTISLPVVICIISPVMDFSFFSQLLGELEKGYGSSDAEMLECLEMLRRKKLPKPGCDLTIFNQLTNGTVVLRRSEDPAEDSYGLDTFLASVGSFNLIKVFASMLLERKVLLHCDSLSKLSQCVQGLYSLLYPFQWDHTFVPVLPGCALDVLGSPMPFIIGLLNDHITSLSDTLVEDVLMLDLDKNIFVHEQGDELKVIPKRLQKALLQAMKSAKSLPANSRSMTVAEAFLRMFVEAIGSYSNYIVMQQDGKKIFEKEPFCTSSTSRSVNTFLQWFTETQMFYTFIDSRLHTSLTPGLFEKRIADYKEELDNMPHSFRENVKELGKRMKNMFGGFRSPSSKTIDKG